MNRRGYALPIIPDLLTNADNSDNESTDPAVVNPWSLDEFQNMFDIPFTMDGS